MTLYARHRWDLDHSFHAIVVLDFDEDDSGSKSLGMHVFLNDENQLVVIGTHRLTLTRYVF